MKLQGIQKSLSIAGRLTSRSIVLVNMCAKIRNPLCIKNKTSNIFESTKPKRRNLLFLTGELQV